MIWLTGSALGVCILMIVGPARRDPRQRPRASSGRSRWSSSRSKDGSVAPGRGGRAARRSPTRASPTAPRSTGSSSASATATSTASTSAGSTRPTIVEARDARRRLLRRAPRVRATPRHARSLLKRGRRGAGAGAARRCGRRSARRCVAQGRGRPRGHREDREGRDRRHQLPRSSRPGSRARKLDFQQKQDPGRDQAAARAAHRARRSPRSRPLYAEKQEALAQARRGAPRRPS